LSLGTDFANGVTKLSNILLNQAWNQLCQCDAGAAPAAPVAPAAPTGTPIYIQPSPMASGTPCATITYGALNESGNHTIARGSLGFYGSGMTLGIKYTADSVIGSPPNFAFQVTWMDQTNTQVGPVTVLQIPGPGTGELYAAFPATAIYAYLAWAVTTGGGGSMNVGATYNIYCYGSGLPGTPGSPCAADPITQSQLDLILKTVTLIQRQAVPFAYVNGTAHSGLTGDGQFSVQGDLGLAVNLTTLPSAIGFSVGNPNALYDVGWINIGTADGWVHREWLVANPFLSMPPDMSAMTLVGYSLGPGVVATITELVREP
jgi:hypothetical protein